MLVAERRAGGGDRGADPGQVAGHDVGVALDDDRLPPPGDLLGQVGAVQHRPLLEQRRFGGVEVLGAVVAFLEPPRAEPDDVSREVADRPDQPPAEPVDRPTPPLARQPAGDQLLVAEAAPAQVAYERLPFVRGVTDAEPLGLLTPEPALGQEPPPDLGGRGEQPLGVELGRGPVRLDQPGPLPFCRPGTYPPSV